MARKPVDRKAAKARRQRVVLAVGGVILVGLLALQGPKTLRLLRGEAAAPVAVATGETATAPSPAPGGTPTPLPRPAPAQARAAVALADSERVPEPGDGQLVSFNLFTSKDPFVQQVKPPEPSDGSGAGETVPIAPDTTVTVPTTPTPPPAPTTTTVPTTPRTPPPTTASPPPTTTSPPPPTGPAPTSPPATTSAPTTTAPAPTDPPGDPTSAVIAVNGTPELVAVGGDFPEADPIFRLVSLTADTAELGIAGGSFDTGVATVTLAKGKTLTLMNTADGTRYELKLVSVSSSSVETTSAAPTTSP